jgi:RNA polymerase sigma-70 factor, ECF subfamily
MDGLIDETRLGGEDEAGFVRDAQHGDRQAFAVLVHRHWDRVFRWLFHLTHDVHEAETATQETFLRAYASLPTLELDLGFRVWLYRLAHETAERDSGPRRKVRLRAPRELRGQDEAPPEQARVREELRRLLERIGRLPRTLRGAFLLRTEAGFRFAEIARILEIPERHVRGRVRMAREKLMEALYVPGPDRIEEPTCQAHRRELLRAEDVLAPGDEAAEHLAICWTCSDWHEQLTRIESRSASIFVPPSRGRDRFLRLFVEPATARSTASPPARRRLVGWQFLVLAAAAVLLVLAGIWLGDAVTDWAEGPNVPSNSSK